MSEKWNKDNLLLLTLAEMSKYDFEKSGYKAYVPYKKVNLFTRILREICFRIPIISREIWYNKEILKETPKYIIIWDALTTKHYLEWLKKNFNESKIVFVYNNMVGKARHLMPNEIPEGVYVWTYDDYDSRKYNLNLYASSYCFKEYFVPKSECIYDVFYVGRDKGRAEELLSFEEMLKKMGLRTKFIITANGRFSKRKAVYHKEIPYSEVMEYVAKSKAILNFTLKNQEGITLRDMEALHTKTKLITTNECIVNTDFYNANNIFIIGRDDISLLPDFLQGPYEDISEDIVNRYTKEAFFDEIL